MPGLMMLAFVRAGIADVSTKPAKLHRPFTAKAHELRGSIANCGTFHVKLYAACHHLHIIFLCAGRCAMIADGRAVQTRIDTALVFVISCHTISFDELAGTTKNAP